jgi:hypothetical protein
VPTAMTTNTFEIKDKVDEQDDEHDGKTLSERKFGGWQQQQEQSSSFAGGIYPRSD